jgi:hypothetical protein
MDTTNHFIHAEEQQELVCLVKQGRSRGQSNFKVDEDIKLASSYAFVTTNAAIGTDQDGATFWEKIRVSFVNRGGGAHRTTVSLQNRFNKVLQAEVNKYIGILQSALREYHSGWVMEDYICDAKKRYQLKFGKVFKHDSVHLILKKYLPKYEIVVASCDARVCRALFLLNKDQEERERGGTQEGINANDEELEDGSRDGVNKNHRSEDAFDSSSLVTPRPSVGKKKAKLMAFADRRHAALVLIGDKGQETSSNAAAKVEFDNHGATKNNARNDSLIRLAAAAEAKNVLVQEQLMFQLFKQNPNSAQSKAYFFAMSERYTSELKKLVPTSTSTSTSAITVTAVDRCAAPAHPAPDDNEAEESFVTVTGDFESPMVHQDDNHDTEERSSTSSEDIVHLLVHHASGAGRCRASHAQLLSSPPHAGVYDDADDNSDKSFPPLPVKQRLVDLLGGQDHTNNTDNHTEDEDDTQLTTLSK